MNIYKLLLLFAFFIIQSRYVSAHFQEQSNSIETTIHITPDDRPITNQISDITLDINDSKQLFSLEECICKLEISKDHKLVESVELYSLKFSYVFEQPGEYMLKLTGSPKPTNKKFNSFEADFKYDVNKDSFTPTPMPIAPKVGKKNFVVDNKVYIITTTVILFLSATLFAFYKK